MAFSFDLFKGIRPVEEGFNHWIDTWYFRCIGFPYLSGKSVNDDRWLFVGNEMVPEKIAACHSGADIEKLVSDECDEPYILVVFSDSAKKLTLSRERTGIIPIAWGYGPKGIAVSTSFLNAQELSGSDQVHSKELLDMWPVYRRIIAPASPLSSIETLSVGSELSYADELSTKERESGFVNIRRKKMSFNEAACLLENVLTDAIECRISKYENVGSWLSGGIDSSLVVALARKKYQGLLTTIFVTFEGYDRNYIQYARSVAEKYGTHHNEVVVNLDQYLSSWAETIKRVETPVNHPGTIGQTIALERHGDSIDGILTGEGADNLLGGSYMMPLLKLAEMNYLIMPKIREALIMRSKRLRERSVLTKGIKKVLLALGTNRDRYVHEERAYGTEEDIGKVFGENVWKNALVKSQTIMKERYHSDMFLFTLLGWNPSTVASEVRLSSAYDVIPLMPFLDYRVIETVCSMPEWIQYHPFIRKYVLKKVASRYFSREFIMKPKEGFGVPLGRWMQHKNFAPFLMLPLESRSLKRGWWKESELREVIDVHKSGQGTDKSAESIPWITVNLELWARICLEGDSPDLYKTPLQ